jgi:hypothetical protein
MDCRKIVLSPIEVHKLYGLAVGTLANLRWAKRGPKYFKKPGGRGVFYLASDVETWLFSNPVLTVDNYKAGSRSPGSEGGDSHG